MKDQKINNSQFDFIIISERLYDLEFDELTIGGIQTYILELAKLITSLNKSVAIFQLSNELNERNHDGISVIGSGFKKANWKKVSNQAISRLKENGIVIWGNEQHSCSLRGVKTIGIQHGITFDIEGLESGLKKKLIGTILNPFYRYLQRKRGRAGANISDNLVCVDYNFQNFFRTYNSSINSSSMYVIPNFTEILREIPVRNSRDTIKIVFARRFVERRGILIFNEAISNLYSEGYDFETHFAGDGKFLEETKGLFNNNSKVSFSKFKSSESLEFHKDKTIAVIPSLGSEGTSLSLLEAMSCGCTPVVTDVGGLTNIVIDSFNGLICSPNAKSLFQALKRLLDDEGLNLKLGRRARETVCASFSKDTWNEKWKDVLNEVEAS